MLTELYQCSALETKYWSFPKFLSGGNRHVTFDTASNPVGAYFQIGEIEFFGDDSFPVDPRAKLATTWGSIKNAR